MERQRLDVVLIILLGFMVYVNSCTINGETESGSCMMVYNGGGAAAVIDESPPPECRLKRFPSSEPYHSRNHPNNMNCEFAILQGRRKYQEDRVFCDLDIPIPFYGKNGVEEVRVGMVAVFDGHGGAEASEMASKLLLDNFLLHTHFISHQAFSFAFNKYYNGSFHLDRLDVGSCALPLVLNESMHMEIFKEALVRTIHDIDTTFLKEASENNLVSGSTATVVLLVDGHILVVYVGDSKALLCSEKFHSPEEVQGTLLREFKRRRRIGYKDMRLATSNGLTRLSAEELTRDHHPDQVDERLRIEAFGGHVVDWTGVPRVNGQLAVSRSIGDVKFKSYGVISLPEVMEWRPLTINNSYLVVSSDGIYEKLTAQDVCDLLPYAHSNGYEMLKLFPSCDHPSAECIVKTAFEEGSMDNLSAVVVPLKSAGLSKNLQNRSSNDEAFSL